MISEEELIPQKKNINIVKISRNSIVVFVKKNIFVISFLTLFFLSTIFGLWKISKYEIFLTNNSEKESKVYLLVERYVNENTLGRNFFEVNSTELAKQITENISYVEKVRIEKNLPNKITIFLEPYTPKLVAYLNGSKCLLLSDEGYSLEQICEEEKCCKEYVSETSMYFLHSSEIDVSKVNNGKEKLLVMDEISKIVKIIESFNLQIQEISLAENILTILTKDNKTFVFTLSNDIDIQVQRYYVTMGKIMGDNLKFKSLDLRFERPVMR